MGISVLNTNLNLEPLRGLTLILGREGHIYMGDTSVSRNHAELKFNGRGIFFRDLNSTNGTYLIDNEKAIPFHKGYVKPNQPIMIGKKRCVLKDLLSSHVKALKNEN